MMSRKQILSGKRMIAGILTAVMVISSAQLPMNAVYAEEIAATVQEGENGGPEQEFPSQSDDAANGENPADEETGQPSGGEDSSDTDAQEPSDGEDSSDADVQAVYYKHLTLPTT